MKTNNPKISIIIITYNQEKLIGRAIESLLCQKEYIYEIVISDDCSEDDTWKVVLEYKKKYPALIKPIKHKSNLGIFRNIESTWNKISGDIIFFLAGDDIYCNKLFLKTNETIFKNKIDFKNEAFLIYFDFVTKFPNGKEKIFHNNLINKHSALSLKIRNLIYNRSMGVSQAVMKNYFAVKKEIGICAEGLIGIQAQMFSDKVYYQPYIGSVYYAEIGVSTGLDKKEHILSYIEYYDVLKEMIKSVNKLTKSDEKWIDYSKAKYEYRLTPTFSNLIKYFRGLIKNTTFKFGFFFLKREYKIFIFNLLKLK